MAEFEECVLHAPAMSAGRDKFDARWKDGVWLGVRMESGESLIGTSEGVVKARDLRCIQAENGGRWRVGDFGKFAGAHWRPLSTKPIKYPTNSDPPGPPYCSQHGEPFALPLVTF